MKILATFTSVAALLLAASPVLAEVAEAPQWPPPAPEGEVAPLPPAEPDWVSPAEGAEPSRPRKVRSIQSGFYLGFRESASFPGGKVYDGTDTDLDSLVLFSMPFRLEAGFRFPFGLGLGGWGQAGWVIPDCSGAYSCAGAVWGYGVQADIRFNQRGAAMPWIGVSYGREYLFLMVDDGYDTWDSTYSGTEVGFQAGIDFRAGSHFALGPHVQYTVGTYDELRIDDGYDAVTLDIPGDAQAEHTWLTIGLKGTATF
jgi:hypothetical protein